MNRYLLTAVFVALPLGAQTSRPSAKPQVGHKIEPSKKEAKSTAKPVKIPDNAEKVDETHFRAKDDKGVTWNYTKTPFGIMKSRADTQSKPSAK